MEEGIYILLAFVLGWAMAQLIKMALALVRGSGRGGVGAILKMAMKSGGMPSGHSASLGAVTMFLGLKLGFNSSLFALSLAMLAIVAYDAVNVRWAVGEQGKMLKKLLRRNVKVVEGHRVIEMLAGLALGALIGLAVYGVALAIG